MSAYDDYISQLKKEQDRSTALAASLGDAVDTNPNDFAEMKRLSRAADMSIEAVPEFRTEAKTTKLLQDIGGPDKFWKEAPRTSNFLVNPDNSKLSHDQVQNMGEFERKFRMLGGGAEEGTGMTISGIGRMLEIAQRNTIEGFANMFLPEPQRGPMNIEPSKPTSDSLTGPMLGEDWVTVGRKLKDQANNEVKIPSSEQTFLDQVAGGLGQVGGQAATHILTGGTISALNLWAQGVDVVYDKVEKDRASQGYKDIAALGGGAVTAITEKWALDKMLGPLAVPVKNQVAAVLSRIGIATASEGVQEFTENVFHDTLRKALTNRDAEIDFGQAGEEGTVGAAVGGTVRSIVEAALHIKNRTARAEEVERKTQVLEALNNLAAANEVRSRDAETFEAWVDQVSEDSPVKNVYVSSEVLRQSGIAESIVKAVPEWEEAIKESLATGRELEIPVAEYMKYIAPTELSTQLLDDLRIENETMTRREAREYIEAESKKLEAQIEERVKLKQQDADFIKSGKEVQQVMFDQIKSTGIYPTNVARDQSVFQAKVYENLAARLNMTPMEAYNAFPNIIAKDEGGMVVESDQMFNQRGEIQPESTAFKEFFKDTKIVDKEGKPLKMYHGTAQNIHQFRAKQAGAIFTTPDPEFADDYTEMSKDWMVDHYDEILSREQVAAAMDVAAQRIREEFANDPDKAEILEHEMRVGDRLTNIKARSIFNKAIAEQMPSGPNIIPVYVNATNPFDYENPEHVAAVVAEMNKFSDTWGRPRGDAAKKFLESGNWEEIEKTRTQDAIRALGFDGFYMKEGKHKNLAVYNSNQVKSVFNQNPTESPEILNQRGKGKVATEDAFDEDALKLEDQITDAGGEVKDTMQVDQLLDSKDIPVITLQDLVGMNIFPTIADRTAAAALYTGIDSSQINLAIPLLGGPFFPLRMTNALSNIVWANRGKGVTSQKAAKLKEGANYMMVLMGDADMHQSNSTVAAAFISTLEAWNRDGRITKKNVKALGQLVKDTGAKAVAESRAKMAKAEAALAAAKDDKAIEKAKKDIAKDKKAIATNQSVENFVGFEDPAALHKYMDSISFDARKRILEVMASKQSLELGAPPMARILEATREPSLAGHRWGDGVILLEVDQESPQVDLGTEGTTPHPDFPVGIRGRVVGKMNAAINYELLWQDWMAENSSKASPRRAFELSKPIVSVTQELVDRIGPIVQKNISTAKQARLAADFAAGNWKTSDDAKKDGGVSPQEFLDAIDNSPAKDTLNKYTLSELKKGIKDKTMKVFQLGDGQAFFMLKTEGERVILDTWVVNEQGSNGIAEPAILLKALQEGATEVSSYAVKSPAYPQGFLPALYSAFGFKENGKTQPLSKLKLTSKQQADAVKYWTESNAGFDAANGLPELVTMEWTHGKEQREGIVRRYLQSGFASLYSGGVEANAEAASAEFDDANQQQIEQDRLANAIERGIGGYQGTVSQPLDAAATQRVVQSIASLSDNELRNLGLTPEDRVAVQEALGQVSGVLNQRATPQSLAEKSRADSASKAGLLNQTNRGGFAPSTLTTILTKEADYSTLHHETIHFLVEVYTRIAQQENPPAQIVADLEALIKFGGVESIEQWNAMSLEERRPAQEAIAYASEIYFFEGKAPSVELESVFDRLAQWMRDIYTSIVDELNVMYKQEFGKDLPILNDEVRSVFDRMLASDKQIQQAQEIRNMAPMFQTQEESGMDDQQWAAYKALTDEADQAGIMDLTKASLRQMKWLGNARSKLLKEMQKKTAALRKDVREQVEQEVNNEPVYMAINFLKRGETKDADGNPIKVTQGHKLSLAEVKALYPESDSGLEAAPDFTTLGYGKYGMLGEQGISPDLVAGMFGFPSGDALVRALVDAKPIKEAVEERTDQRMLEEHGELYDQKTVDAEIEKALHNQARAKFVAVELRFLAKATAPVRLMLQAAKQAAKKIITNTAVGDINPREFAIAEGRAAKQTTAALKKGDSLAAQKAKQQQLLNNQLAAQAIEAKAEVEKAIDGFRKLFRSDEKIAKGRNMDLVNAARAILGYYGIGPKGKSPLDFVETLRTYNPDFYADIEPLILQAASGSKLYTDMTLDEFRSLNDAINSLWFQSKRDNEAMIEGRMVSIEQIRGELVGRLEEIGIPAVVAGEQAPFTKKEKFIKRLLNVKAIGRRVEYWADSMDGSAGGKAFTQYIWRPVRTALDNYRIDRNKYVSQYVDMVAKLTLGKGKIDASQEIGYTFGDENGGSGKAELLGAMLHMGNESNFKKLLVGRGWGSINEAGVLDASRWNTLINRMIAEGHITKADFDFLQSVWDLNEEIKPLAQKAHHDMFGYYFKEVEATPLVTPFGTYRGGYVPAKTDPDMVRDAQKNAKMEALESDFRQSMPSTGLGFTKGRVEYNKPLSLDLRTMTKHIDDVIRFAHVQPAIKDVLKIIRSRDFADNLSRIDSEVVEAMLLPWLNRAARQITSEVGMNSTIDSFWRTVRQRTGVAIMFGNLTNALQQFTGHFLTGVKVNKSNMKAALAMYMKSPNSVTQSVVENSKFMEDRLKNQIFDIQDNLNQLLLNPTKFEKVQAWTSQHGYFLQTAFQNQVDIVAWVGAYNQAIEELGSGYDNAEAHAEAVHRADAVVRMTQSSLTAEDKSAFEVGTPFMATLLQFSGYFNMVANLNATEFTKIFRDLGWRGHKGMLFQKYLLGFALPMIVADAIVRTLGGGWDDEDDDGYLDEFMEWFFGSQIKGAVAFVPVAGPAVWSLTNVANDKPYDDKMSSSPAVSTLEGSTFGVAKAAINLVDKDKEVTGKNVRDVLTAISLATGVPVAVLGRPLGYAVDVNRGKVNPTSDADYVRGLVTGKASEESVKK